MVNNAGIFTGLHTIVDETEDEYDRTMAVNAKSVWLGCKFAIRQMLTQEPVDGSRGRIVNIASIGGLVGLAAEPAYCAAKGAVVNLTRQLAVDFAPERINVNAICPGFLATAMVRPFLDDPELNKVLHAKSPWPELGTAEDVGKAPSSWPPTTPAGPPAPCSPSTAASPPPDRRTTHGIACRTRSSSSPAPAPASAAPSPRPAPREGAKVVVSDVHENPNAGGFEDDAALTTVEAIEKTAAGPSTSAATSPRRTRSTGSSRRPCRASAGST